LLLSVLAVVDLEIGSKQVVIVRHGISMEIKSASVAHKRDSMLS
jgi:hypothetical protein